MRKMITFLTRVLLFPIRRALLFRRVVLLKIHGKAALTEFFSATSVAREIAWLEYGTLLGIFRDKKFLNRDSDLDIGLLYSSETEKFIDDLDLTKFKVVSVYKDKENGLLYKIKLTWRGVLLDVNIFHHHKHDSVYTLLNTPSGWQRRPFPRNSCIPVKDLLGFPAPRNPSKHLAHHYGPNFMIKDPKWSAIHVANLHPYTSSLNIIKYTSDPSI